MTTVEGLRSTQGRAVRDQTARTRPYVIGIPSAKGGAGKSTIALNLAAQLAEAGHTVTIVDTDFHWWLTRAVIGADDAMADGGTIGACLLAPASVRPGILYAFGGVRSMADVYLLPGDGATKRAARRLAGIQNTRYRLRRIAHGLATDVVIIDGGPIVSNIADGDDDDDGAPDYIEFMGLSVLLASDLLLLPTQLHQLDVDGVALALTMIADKRTAYPEIPDDLLVVPTNYRRVRLQNDAVEVLREALGDSVTTPIPQSEMAARMGVGHVAVSLRASAACRAALTDLAARVCAHGGLRYDAVE